MGLKIVDVAGQPRYYLQGMRKFVIDKGMAACEAFTLNFVKGKKLFMFG
ncbi:hypothetical protein Hanom_Chr11g01035101 [Helianthus anomalus]